MKNKINLGFLGLGKMGLGMVKHLHEKGYEVFAWNRSSGPRNEAKDFGVQVFEDIEQLISSLNSDKKIIWLMLPQAIVDEILEKVTVFLSRGDVIIDGGNSYFKDSVRRAQKLRESGINFIDAGVSGGPSGARGGACIMVGGEKEAISFVEPLFMDLSAPNGYKHVGKAGAGHFVKMVHNGIEYGMMQSIAEGFEVMKKSDFNLNLTEVANLYNNKSVIESRLVGWLEDGFKKYGENLDEISSSVDYTGEGEWTVKTAEELGVSVPVIKDSFEFRVQSKRNPSFAGKVLSVLRNQFGGHDIEGRK